MIDESHLPIERQSLEFRLHKRAEIRRQCISRKSVPEGTPDRISDLLEEAAVELSRRAKKIEELEDAYELLLQELAGEDW